MGSDTQAKQAAEVIRPLVPIDVRERVERAVSRWNSPLRDQIRATTALRLSTAERQQSIPIQVSDGFPATLAELIIEHDDPAIWILLAGLPKLGGAVEGLQYLLEYWERLERWRGLSPSVRESKELLARALQVILAIQAAVAGTGVDQQIRGMEKDILGAYRFAEKAPRVEIYWMPVALLSGILDVSIESLTIVVLCHELVHGYSHLGLDSDDRQWDTPSFSRSPSVVVEGLAQFHTEAISSSYRMRDSGAALAFMRLLTLQSGPYVAYRAWLEGATESQSEVVRFAMIAARRALLLDEKLWSTYLEAGMRELTRKSMRGMGLDGNS
jgi:hypothetical protein